MIIDIFTKKETVAIVELVTAILCVIAFTFLTLNILFPIDMVVFWYQAALFTAGFFLFLFGLSTWFYRSQIPKTSHQVNLFTLVILCILPIGVILTAVMFSAKYSGDNILDLGKEIWGDDVLMQLSLAAILGYVIGILLILTDILLAVKVFKYYR